VRLPLSRGSFVVVSSGLPQSCSLQNEARSSGGSARSFHAGRAPNAASFSLDDVVVNAVGTSEE